MLVLIWASLLLTATVFIPHKTSITCMAASSSNTLTECQKTSNGSLLTVSPRILNSSACKKKSDLLTCVCFIEGFTIPRITWLLLDSISKYTVLKNVAGLLVTSNITVSLKGLSNGTDESITKNNDRETLRVDWKTPTFEMFFNCLKKTNEDQPLLIPIVFGVGFLIGSFVSTFIACLAIKCHRKKKSFSTENLELVTTETATKGCDDGIPDLQNNDFLDIQDDGIQNQVAAASGEEPDGDLIDSNMSPKETVYSDIDFSALKQKNPTDAKQMEDITETEYAEIKRGEMDEAQENEAMDSEMLEGNDETEVMIEHQEEAKQDMLGEEVTGENVPLYSNTNEDEN